MSTIFDCTDIQSRPAGIRAAVDAAKAGRLVVLPTDTVYGIGCNAFDANAVRSLLAAKNRGPDMPVPVQVDSWDGVDELVSSVPETARKLMEAFWPGALSVVLKQAPALAWNLGNTGDTVLLRMPQHPVAIELLRQTGPMAVSSANVSGQPPATTADEARAQLGESVSVYLDGGPATAGVASTIVDLTGTIPRILREGPITAAVVADVLDIDPALLIGPR
ncbi:L-threonylcarbamoyladenylate synthase [Rhodococcus sp. NPDC056960]|uniref:L-threonylcarbamoyladenylate synthase n=1 Tax=Rhodococcus sp. NPDC056960 TaxID=3345982 RepID=UPI00363D4BC8